MYRHIREAIKKFRVQRPDVTVNLERGRVHRILKVTLPDGRVRTLACAGTPKDPDIAERRTFKELLRLANEPPLERTHG